MKLHQELAVLPIGTAILALVSQPVLAASTEITAIQLNSTTNGIELVFETQGDNRPPIFTVSRGNSTVADITNAQLRLPNGKPFRQDNPIPGITSVVVSQLDANSIRVTVNGATRAPIGKIIRQDNAGLILSFNQAPGVGDQANNTPSTTSQPPSTGQGPSVTPPSLRRAVAPPVGDIAIAPINVTPGSIDLGTAERVPRLLLRDAPVREVLTLLARAAGLNVAFAGGDGATGGGPTISLDIENESVQDVFNYVIRLSGLQANRAGQTIFVGKTLPNDAQNRIMRTFRLNQIKATSEGKIEQSLKTAVNTGGGAGDNTNNAATTSGSSSSSINRETTITEEIQNKGAKEILESYGANAGEGSLLKGLEVVADARANSVTLIGTPRTLEIATNLLTQLDIRRRQVAVNVQMVDVNLSTGRSSNFDLINRSEAGSGQSLIASFVNGFTTLSGGIGRDLLLRLTGSLTNGSGKILTNPTLIVQEGSSAQVNLGDEVFQGFETSPSTIDPVTGQVLPGGRRPIIKPAGVIFNVTVDQIDDNGFITLNVTPEVGSPSGSFNADGALATLLSQRRLETGRMRLRDGQSLVLTGIIQDRDLSDVSKVPILGDIPLLGRLFRRENKTNQRNELIVIVTPQIMDDSDQSRFGYQYTPGPEVEKMLSR